MKFTIAYKPLLPIILFIVVALAYFSPVLKGQAISQSDITQYIGMAKEQNDFRKSINEEPYWTNSAFGGMPTYQLGAKYPHNYIKKVDTVIRFLPRPADYLFLYFISFYILLLVLKVDYRLAALGALGFGFSTYLIIILGVGHNAKAHAIGYFPLVLAGIFMIFRGRRIGGFLLTTLAMGLEISANHFQMTYYLFLLILVFGILKLIEAIKEKTLPIFSKSVGVVALAFALALSINATNLMATKQYADWSTRGKSELTITPEGLPKKVSTGLDKDYITQYSYGIFETFNLFVPRLLGGGNSENLGKDSQAYKVLLKKGASPKQAMDFTSSIPGYWGNQPIVVAPAYIGAVILFLFVLALFVIKKSFLKKFLLTGIMISLVLSWGKNFEFLTNIMIDYFPMYNKFRAVTSIQVLLEICVPILALIGLQKILFQKMPKEELLKGLKWSASICVGLLLIFLLSKSAFNFEGQNDALYEQYYGLDLIDAIILDRQSMYTNDVLRSLSFVILCVVILFLFLKEKINALRVIMSIVVLVLFDLGGVAKRYVNNDDFIPKHLVEKPFKSNKVDKSIREDKTFYRVWNEQEGLNGARTSYFHKSIGGYHAAKPRRIQELFDYQVSKQNFEVVNLLNIKYVIQEGNPHINENANGNVWFVKKLKWVKSANEEIEALDSIDSKNIAIIHQKYASSGLPVFYEKDSLAQIKLIEYQPNKLVYNSKNQNDGFAVFSEMYYPHGWKVTIDGKLSQDIRVDYALRGLFIPKGSHKIIFSFEPQVVKTGSRIALAGFLIFILLCLGSLWQWWKPKQSVLLQ